MENGASQYTLGQLAAKLHGSFEGPPDALLRRPSPAGEADPEGVTFAESEHYLRLAESVPIGAIIVGREERESEKPLIRVDHPRSAFGMVLALFHRPLPINDGIHETAIVHPDAEIAQGVRVGPYAVVERGAKLLANSTVHAYCYIGEDCTVGEGSLLYPHCVLYRDVSIGSSCILHAGCVLGADGFGFVWDGKNRMKVPQVGKVRLGDNVEVGANTTIDRATAGETRVGDGTKLDNLVMIAHNVSIGKDGVIAAQSGISGSSRVGDRVVMGGNVGLTDHVKIPDDVVLGGRSSVEKDLPASGEYFGTPARPRGEALRMFLLLPRLPELFAKLRALEKEIKELKEER